MSASPWRCRMGTSPLPAEGAGRWDCARPGVGQLGLGHAVGGRGSSQARITRPGRTPCRCRRCTGHSRGVRPPSCRASTRRGFAAGGRPSGPGRNVTTAWWKSVNTARPAVFPNDSPTSTPAMAMPCASSCRKSQSCSASGSRLGPTKVGAYQTQGFAPSAAALGGKMTKPACPLSPRRKSSRRAPNCRDCLTWEISAVAGAIAAGGAGRGGEQQCCQCEGSLHEFPKGLAPIARYRRGQGEGPMGLIGRMSPIGPIS